MPIGKSPDRSGGGAAWGSDRGGGNSGHDSIFAFISILSIQKIAEQRRSGDISQITRNAWQFINYMKSWRNFSLFLNFCHVYISFKIISGGHSSGESAMASKLEDLRKNLLGSSVSSMPRTPPSPSPQVYSALRENPDAPDGSLREDTHHEDGGNVREDVAREMLSAPPRPHSDENKLARAVEKMFEPARVCEQRWAELARALESLEHMTRSAAKALEPMTALCDQMHKLSETFGPMLSFEQELATMAASFSPVKDLHGEVTRVIESMHRQLSQLMRSFEPVEACKKRMADLTDTFDKANELQARFSELAEKFRPAANNQKH